MYEPVRRCRSATAFVRVPWPGAANDARPSHRWSPCNPNAPGAVPMTLMQVRPEELLEPEVFPSDFQAALRKVRPSISPSDLQQFQAWTNKYGMDGETGTSLAVDTVTGEIFDDELQGAAEGSPRPCLAKDLACNDSQDAGCICSWFGPCGNRRGL